MQSNHFTPCDQLLEIIKKVSSIDTDLENIKEDITEMKKDITKEIKSIQEINLYQAKKAGFFSGIGAFIGSGLFLLLIKLLFK